MIDHITLHADKATLNPLLNPGDFATLTVHVVDPSGQVVDLSKAAIQYSIATVAANGGVEVVRLEGNRLVAVEGGVAEVTAAVIANGTAYQSRLRFVVRPFFREYHKTLTLKLFLGQDKHPDPAWGRRVTFQQALEVIRKVDSLTLGIPKIVYLVGWQTGGHDWGYPDWGPVDPVLKRPQDATATESLKWLIAEARQYRTTISLHINMFDAYQSSPIWEEYIARDVIARDRRGRLFVRGEKYHEETVYCVCYTREWQEGLAQRRIDRLLDMLPELIDGHTIHIDAFHTAWKGYLASAWHGMQEHGGVTLESEVETQRKIFQYFRSKGLDVTCEGMQSDFVGLQPMIWWYHKSPRWQMKVPERLCARGRTTHRANPDFRFGSSMHGEEILVKDIENLPGFLQQFCETTLPWYFLSQLDRSHLSRFGRLSYSEGVTAGWEMFQRVIRKGNFILRHGDDLFVPALWRETKTIIAYSRRGYLEREWILPADWSAVQQVDVSAISLSGLRLLLERTRVAAGRIRLSLEPGQAVAVVASKPLHLSKSPSESDLY
jgi:hypothetical protein